MKYTVVWFAVGCHGYHEVIAEGAHAALASVVADMAPQLKIRARFKVFEGTPLRGGTYCMDNMTYIDG